MRAMTSGVALALLALTLGAGGAQASDYFQLLRLDKSVVKWGKPETGTGARVSYAFVSETTRYPGARNCQEMQQPEALLGGSSIARAAFEAEVEAAFAMCSEAANISFHQAEDPKKAQILIALPMS